MRFFITFFTFFVYWTPICAFLTPSQKIFVLRRQIDFVDNKICHLIETRMRLCKQIGNLKKNNLPIEDPAREAKLLNRLVIDHPSLSPKLIEEIWTSLLEESKNIQMENKLPYR